VETFNLQFKLQLEEDLLKLFGINTRKTFLRRFGRGLRLGFRRLKSGLLDILLLCRWIYSLFHMHLHLSKLALIFFIKFLEAGLLRLLSLKLRLMFLESSLKFLDCLIQLTHLLAIIIDNHRLMRCRWTVIEL